LLSLAINTMKVDLNKLVFSDKLLYASLLLSLKPGETNISSFELLRRDFTPTKYLAIEYLNQLCECGLIEVEDELLEPGEEWVSIDSNFRINIVAGHDDGLLANLLTSIRGEFCTDLNQSKQIVKLALRQLLVGESIRYLSLLWLDKGLNLDSSVEPPKKLEQLVLRYSALKSFSLIKQTVERTPLSRSRMILLSKGSAALLEMFSEIAIEVSNGEANQSLIDEKFLSSLPKCAVSMIITEHCMNIEPKAYLTDSHYSSIIG